MLPAVLVRLRMGLMLMMMLMGKVLMLCGLLLMKLSMAVVMGKMLLLLDIIAIVDDHLYIVLRCGLQKNIEQMKINVTM